MQSRRGGCCAWPGGWAIGLSPHHAAMHSKAALVWLSAKPLLYATLVLALWPTLEACCLVLPA